MASDDEATSICRRPGCGAVRTRYSVFCEQHHREQLERTAPVEELPWREVWLQITGPFWLNGARGACASLAYLFADAASTAVYLALVAATSTWVGWRWAHRMIWLPQRGWPVVERPGSGLALLIAVYSAGTIATIAWIAWMVLRVLDNGIPDSNALQGL